MNIKFLIKKLKISKSKSVAKVTSKLMISYMFNSLHKRWHYISVGSWPSYKTLKIRFFLSYPPNLIYVLMSWCRKFSILGNEIMSLKQNLDSRKMIWCFFARPRMKRNWKSKKLLEIFPPLGAALIQTL